MSRHQGTVVTIPTGIKGAFRMTLTDGACWWSPGMFALHGFPTNRAPWLVPTTRMMINHVHPADRRATANAWAHLLADGHLVALHYRIVGADDVVRPVFVLASTNHERANPPTVVTGVMELDAR
jgi:hypothetical protein